MGDPSESSGYPKHSQSAARVVKLFPDKFIEGMILSRVRQNRKAEQEIAIHTLQRHPELTQESPLFAVID